MNDRIKMLGVFALLGFVGGMIANVGFQTVWPWLVETFPTIFTSQLFISGLVGALITTCFVVIWAYLSQPTTE